ncbi:MAG: TolC family protein [Verrucomicrobia bacterium]|nr:TolC family protein [Verrucomicrobiota bacterium]
MKALHSIVSAVWLGFAFTTVNGEDLSPLTLQEAHVMALRDHPQISVADLKALAARQVTRQFRSGFFPTLAANVMSVGTANENTRLGAIGGLNNPSIFDRNAEGLVLSQLITDFGRTANLTGSAKFRAQAEANNAQATREQILLAVDASFFAAQQAQSVTRVAEQTVTTRQLFLDQVSALATNKLRSDLDVSFARVNVEDGKLLLSKAQNDLQSEFTRLANLMGLREPKSWHLMEEPPPPLLSTNIYELVEQALQLRPELLSLRNSREAALKFARAEKALHYPTISAIGSAGVIPIGDSHLPENYAAAGLSLTLPLYAGGLYSARQQEAELRARAAEEGLRDLENNVIRDVRISWLNAQNAFDRLRITGQLLDNAKQSFDLAQARYNNGISSIVEFNQAQLNLLSAQIAYANTQYEYLLQRSALNFQTGSLR